MGDAGILAYWHIGARANSTLFLGDYEMPLQESNHNIYLHSMVSCIEDDDYNPTILGLATARNIHNGNDSIYFWKAHIHMEQKGYDVELFKNGSLIKVHSYTDMDLKDSIISIITAYLGE